jgi:hypothetical protein
MAAESTDCAFLPCARLPFWKAPSQSPLGLLRSAFRNASQPPTPTTTGRASTQHDPALFPNSAAPERRVCCHNTQSVRALPLQLPSPLYFCSLARPTLASTAISPPATRLSRRAVLLTLAARPSTDSQIPPMAHGTKGPAVATTPPNGSAHAPAPNAVNRKKQKRREKEAAKKAAQDPSPPATLRNGVVGGSSHLPANASHSRQPVPHYADPELDEQPYDDDADFYSDEEAERYEHAYGTNGHYQQGYAHAPISSGSKKPRKKKKGVSAPSPHAYTQHVAPRHSPASTHAHSLAGSDPKNIWNTTTLEERERIREFWLSLGEEDRKSLVKIEKEAVLRKMKEQQKHSCSCSVCGRKRTAIEEELEVLYDAYYEELEQYAHHQQDVGRLVPDANFGHASSAPHPRPLMTTHPPPGHYDDEDEDEYSGEEEDEDYSNSEISSDGEYDSEERSLPPPEAADFITFGSSLTVKGIELYWIRKRPY